MPKKKPAKIKLPPQKLDWSNTKPPKRPAIESMLENLHAAEKKKPAKDL